MLRTQDPALPPRKKKRKERETFYTMVSSQTESLEELFYELHRKTKKGSEDNEEGEPFRRRKTTQGKVEAVLSSHSLVARAVAIVTSVDVMINYPDKHVQVFEFEKNRLKISAERKAFCGEKMTE